jgi:hypothetical protein
MGVIETSTVLRRQAEDLVVSSSEYDRLLACRGSVDYTTTG